MAMPALAINDIDDVACAARGMPSSPITPAIFGLPMPPPMEPRRRGIDADALATLFTDSCRVAPPSEPLPQPTPRRSLSLPPCSPFVLDDASPYPSPPADDVVSLEEDDADEIQVHRPLPPMRSLPRCSPAAARSSSASFSSLSFSTCSSASFGEGAPSAPPTPKLYPAAPVNAILIAGAPLSVSEPALVDLFASLGPVVYSRTLPLADGTRLARLLYVSRAAVTSAVRLDGARLGGRKLTVVHAGKEGVQLRQLAAALNDQLAGATATAASGIVARAMAAWTTAAAVPGATTADAAAAAAPARRPSHRPPAEDARALALRLVRPASPDAPQAPVTAAVREARARVRAAAAEEARGERTGSRSASPFPDVDGWSWGSALSAATRAASWVSSPWPLTDGDSPC
eukprot:TRINITY_DN2734_c0_g1_i3.p1 TRINITY_DN2734_c0_g1~~TRINITY_DN2734_c0_g1_i3.p1  ORF type:complete len:402 (-),score=108.56 TRINITY_DN2734_c0_g1_i3:309-1514(-)